MRVGDSFCPGILHAVPAKDGLLLRIRIPGGLIDASQLRAIAVIAVTLPDGQIEITSRANIQLRGMQQKDLNNAVGSLESAGLLPSRSHDRVRNIIASPFAGMASDELLDTSPLVRELDARLLTDPMLAELHPKFSMSLDGGGKWYSREIDDLALRAVTSEGERHFHLALGGLSTGLSVGGNHAIDCMIAAAKLCLQISKQFELPVRGKRIAAMPVAWERMMDSFSAFMKPCVPEKQVIAEQVVAEIDWPIGIHATRQAGVVSVVPSVPLGRLNAQQAQLIAAIADEHGASLRLAPWRGIVLGAIAAQDVSNVSRQLEDAGLSLDGKDGYRGLSACAGLGCDASFADVRADAMLLAQKLAGRDMEPGWSVNISGCEKQCAMRNGATAELIANESGYSLKLRGTTVASHCDAETAIEAVAVSHAQLEATTH
jgi:precorrin-3B synthase